jgi:hypothetical protein
MVDYEEDTKKLTSEFNEGGFQILRLHKCWTKCDFYSKRGLFSEWKWELDRAWIELSTDAKRLDEDKYTRKNMIYNIKIQLAKNRDEIYKALQDKEMFLRNLQEEAGKGSKKKSVDDEDFDV